MPMRSTLFLIVFVALATVLFTLLLMYAHRLWGPRQASIEDLLGRLAPLDRSGLAIIAADLIEARPLEDDLFDTSQIWNLIGGMDGLGRMEANCAVLIDLASLLQQRYPEALVVAEELRLNAREIGWHLDRLRGAARLGKVESVFQEYAQRAIASYYSMTQRVLALYAWGDLQAHARLQQVL